MKRDKNAVKIVKVPDVAQVKDISGIKISKKVNVAFIKINANYKKCLNEAGNPDMNRVRECAAGTWPIAEKRRKEIEYVFALQEGMVVGIFHVKDVKVVGDAYAADKAMPGFPSFPPEARKMDRWVSQFESLAAAKQALSPDDYDEFEKRLTKLDANKQERSKERVLSQWREKVYFIFDDEIIPDDLKAFENCILTRDGKMDYFKSQWPVLFNF